MAYLCSFNAVFFMNGSKWTKIFLFEGFGTEPQSKLESIEFSGDQIGIEIEKKKKIRGGIGINW